MAKVPERRAPAPSYLDPDNERLSEQLQAGRDRLRQLVQAGAPPEELERARAEILRLRRELRDGGHLRPGDVLSERYRVLDRLGSGGFATVWRAWDEDALELVAIKVLHGQHARDASRLERFYRGARTMARLHHESV